MPAVFDHYTIHRQRVRGPKLAQRIMAWRRIRGPGNIASRGGATILPENDETHRVGKSTLSSAVPALNGVSYNLLT
jgi:hypothetical protein